MLIALMLNLRGKLQSVFRDAQDDALDQALRHPEVDRKVIAVLVTTCIILTLQQFLFRGGSFDSLPGALRWLGAEYLAERIDGLTYGSQERQLAQLLYWATGSVINYVLIPALVVKLYLRERVADFGLRFRGIWANSWLYLAMFLVMIGPLAFFSRTEAFQAKYPFYRISPGEPFWPRLWIWEAAYICQFFALEFFFRGFMVHGLRRRLGFYAIFVMMVPYCMIHFQKPMPECLGAIAAGAVLGFMSLKTRSIWLGACLHVAVALSMDFLALWHRGML
jgi:membrane protease YdiL (CAAX protease family)